MTDVYPEFDESAIKHQIADIEADQEALIEDYCLLNVTLLSPKGAEDPIQLMVRPSDGVRFTSLYRSSLQSSLGDKVGKITGFFWDIKKVQDTKPEIIELAIPLDMIFFIALQRALQYTHIPDAEYRAALKAFIESSDVFVPSK
jgi:hypothetical protein